MTLLNHRILGSSKGAFIMPDASHVPSWAQDSLEVRLLLGRRPRDKYFHRQVMVQVQGGS